MRLKDRVAVITGGAGGIGRATARELAREGAKVVVADIDSGGGEAAAKQIREFGGEAIFIETDVSSFGSVAALVRRTVETYGRLDVMFNNAGVENQPVGVLEMPVEEYLRTVEINQHGVFYGIKAAGTAMKETGGVIINTASVYGFLADRRQFPYHASKGAVVMMTKAAALDLAKYNIRVVAIAPGLIDTGIVGMWKKNPEVWGIVERAQMRRRAGTPEEVAKVVTFLASDDASFVNGSVIFVDDGAASFKR
ncbi:MAG TPA: glucose 1-dehydrogenase [Alicyclobacillus sp.]|nr:glucose 1-dehydrogenase [Alicyclobacillus sp.]